LRKCHSAEYSRHYSHFQTQAKVWSSGFYWPEMHEDLHHAPNAKEPETSLKEILCPWAIIYKSICLMCGE
jgi:hypothetical protein